MKTARKDVREIIQLAENSGFTLDRYTGSGHYKMHHGSGGTIIIPSTPRGSRWKKNVLADIRRVSQQGGRP